MSYSFFISDLHLAAERAHIVELFFRFVAGPAKTAQALYVLGDLFEYWVGDDNLDDSLNRSVAQAFSALAAGGTAVYFMHGNRDLLVGAEFSRRASARLLEDPTLIDLADRVLVLRDGRLVEGGP